MKRAHQNAKLIDLRRRYRKALTAEKTAQVELNAANREDTPVVVANYSECSDSYVHSANFNKWYFGVSLVVGPPPWNLI